MRYNKLVTLILTTLLIGVGTLAVGCSSSDNDKNASIDGVSTTSVIEELIEPTTEQTTEVPTDILPDDLLKLVEKSMDSLDSLETRILVTNKLDIKLGKIMQDDLGFDLTKVDELGDKLDEYYPLNNVSDMLVKFDSDTVYINYTLTEENGLMAELDQTKGITQTITEQYLELDGEQMLFEKINDGSWKKDKVYDLSKISVNPVQTAIELLNDFKADKQDRIKLYDIITIDGTISSSSARSILEGDNGEDKRVPAKIIYNNKEGHLESIEIDLSSLYTNEYLFDLFKPKSIKDATEFGKYVKPPKYDLKITFSNANSTSVDIPKDVLETK